jgi:hypothetical protein
MRLQLPRIMAVAFLGLLAPALAHAGPVFGVNLDNGNLYQVSTSNAALTLVGNTGVTNWADIQFAPNGTLYGFTTSGNPTPTLYTINPVTAAATPIGPLGIGFVFEGALAFAPNGTAYGGNAGSSGADQLFTINLSTGQATSIGTLAGSHDINGLVWRSDGKLIGLDRVTNSLLVIDPTTLAFSTLAAIGPTVGGVGGMTIDGTTGFFSTSGPGGSIPGSNSLFSFDLFSGNISLVGSFAPTITSGNGISGIAAQPSAATVPEPASLTLVGIGAVGLLGYGWRRRSKS